MLIVRLIVLALLLVIGTSLAPIQKRAFVSVLLSDDYLLPTRVLAYNLKSLHPELPYIVLCTEDVSNYTLQMLTKHENVLIKLVDRINSPQYSTHQAKKFQYTKINLWAIDEYESLVYIDLDTTLVNRIDELFQCGQFCASLRHSDAFNTGVMVLQPNRTVYNDMLQKIHVLKSYDGGDQGFLNSYFWQIKFSQMFNLTIERCKNEPMQRISAAYNFDVGIYYLSGHQLVKPKLIHYTLLFVKPWHWYGYPLFDLNWHWLANRLQMQDQFADTGNLDLNIKTVWKHVTVVCVLLLLHSAGSWLPLCQANRARKVFFLEQKLTPVSIVLLSLSTALWLTPFQLVPHAGWSFFTLNFSTLLASLSFIYLHLRFGAIGRAPSLIGLAWNFVFFLLQICCINFVAWHILIQISAPTTRIKIAVGILIFYAIIIYCSVQLLIFGEYRSKWRWSHKQEVKSDEMCHLTDVNDA